MKRAYVLAFVGCGGSVQPVAHRERMQAIEQAAEEDVYRPSYSNDELKRALVVERAAGATAERAVVAHEAKPSEPGLHVARADLAVRKRFIASLEACEATGLACPPRLDEPAWTWDPDPEGPLTNPKLDTQVRFDVASWQRVAAELHGRACACRTIACVGGLEVAIDHLEGRPMPAVQADETASLSITRARECLYRLRGKRPMPQP